MSGTNIAGVIFVITLYFLTKEVVGLACLVDATRKVSLWSCRVTILVVLMVILGSSLSVGFVVAEHKAMNNLKNLPETVYIMESDEDPFK